MKPSHLFVTSLLFLPTDSRAFLGTELGPLLQLVSGQVQELERLAENVGLAKDQLNAVREINDGVNRTVDQIQTLQQIIERTKGLDPTGVRSLSDLNELLERAQGTKSLIDDFLFVKLRLAEQSIDRSAVQSDTAYKMGQEMVSTGSRLAHESETASPGRATQIGAAAQSAQMLSQGVQLQTLAQIAELQALLLELQKTQIQKQLLEDRARRFHVLQSLKQRPTYRKVSR